MSDSPVPGSPEKEKKPRVRKAKKGANGSITLPMNGNPKELLLSIAEVFQAQSKSAAEYAAAIATYAENMPIFYTKKGGFDEALNGKKRKMKKDVDPNAPKKPMTAYQAYVSGNMDRVKQEEGITNVQAMSRLAELWKLMPEPERNNYHETAKVMKEKYLKQMNEYNGEPLTSNKFDYSNHIGDDNMEVEGEESESPKKGRKAKKSNK